MQHIVSKDYMLECSVFLKNMIFMYRFDSKRFCRDCRRNVIREFKELKELKRLRREPRCTSCFCVADTAFQYEVWLSLFLQVLFFSLNPVVIILVNFNLVIQRKIGSDSGCDNLVKYFRAFCEDSV